MSQFAPSSQRKTYIPPGVQEPTVVATNRRVTKTYTVNGASTLTERTTTQTISSTVQRPVIMTESFYQPDTVPLRSTVGFAPTQDQFAEAQASRLKRDFMSPQVTQPKQPLPDLPNVQRVESILPSQFSRSERKETETYQNKYNFGVRIVRHEGSNAKPVETTRSYQTSQSQRNVTAFDQPAWNQYSAHNIAIPVARFDGQFEQVARRVYEEAPQTARSYQEPIKSNFPEKRGTQGSEKSTEYERRVEFRTEEPDRNTRWVNSIPNSVGDNTRATAGNASVVLSKPPQSSFVKQEFQNDFVPPMIFQEVGNAPAAEQKFVDSNGYIEESQVYQSFRGANPILVSQPIFEQPERGTVFERAQQRGTAYEGSQRGIGSEQPRAPVSGGSQSGRGHEQPQRGVIYEQHSQRGIFEQPQRGVMYEQPAREVIYEPPQEKVTFEQLHEAAVRAAIPAQIVPQAPQPLAPSKATGSRPDSRGAAQQQAFDDQREYFSQPNRQIPKPDDRFAAQGGVQGGVQAFYNERGQLVHISNGQADHGAVKLPPTGRPTHDSALTPPFSESNYNAPQHISSHEFEYGDFHHQPLYPVTTDGHAAQLADATHVLNQSHGVKSPKASAPSQLSPLPGQATDQLPAFKFLKLEDTGSASHEKVEIVFEGIGKYIGGVRFGQLDGYGILYTADGRSILYEGEFEENQFNGVGIMFNDPKGAPGDAGFTGRLPTNWIRYEGLFLKNKREGFGEVFFKDGGHYSGEFSNDRANGFGTFVTRAGQKLAGVWRDDQLVSAE